MTNNARSAAKRTHGHTQQIGGRGGKVRKSLTYQSWSAMNDRCLMERHRWYDAYGGRGIVVCDRWRRGQPDAFANFLEDLGERPAKNMTLDRINVNGNYELHGPDGLLQCKWADKSEQRRNQRPREKDCTAAPVPVDSGPIEEFPGVD